MRFAVESWSPEYGAPTDAEALAQSETGDVDATVERDLAAWQPLDPPPRTVPVADLLVVDGVQRVDALVWIRGADGTDRSGLCGSYGAGAVRCRPGGAEIAEVRIGRGLFCHPCGADHLRTRHGDYLLHQADSDDPVRLRQVLHAAMIDLEVEVAGAAGDAEVVLVDGPLRQGHQHTELVGYIKTHARTYGPQVVADTVADLRPGQRTPLLVVGAYPRFTWYQRLPGGADHAWGGVVRLQASARLPVADAAALADRLTATLGPLAAQAHKDPRAPQNLVPIGALERTLRRRLGDPRLLHRALRDAAAR